MQKNFFSQKISGFLTSFMLAVALVLTGCGGAPSGTTTASGVSSGGASGSTTLTATVATGAALAGATVYIEDSKGQIFTSSATSAKGTVSITVASTATPFMLRVHNPPTVPVDMYACLPAGETNVNITPITTLEMYELNSKADPGLMYQNLSFSTNCTLGNIATAQAAVLNTLSSNPAVAALQQDSGFRTMFDAFSPGTLGDVYDTALDRTGNITALNTTSGVVLTTTANCQGCAGQVLTYAAAGATGVTSTPSVTLSMCADSACATPLGSPSVSSTSPVYVQATVKNASGNGVSNAIVTFATNDKSGAFAGGANTALTNSSGVATVTLTTSNTGGGAATVTANATVNGTLTTGSLNYAIGSSSITLGASTASTGTLNISPATLSAYGTASVSVDVLNTSGGTTSVFTTPMTVNFTSTCAANGKAKLTSSVTSVSGVAAASYLDNGCNSTDPITATLSNGATATGNLVVNAPKVGSIQFVSVVTNPVTTPTMITLKGTGGAGRSETAQVTFKVVDSSGNPFSAPVAFSLNTTLGGLALSSSSATSDPATGYAVTNVQAGTFSTAVRVTATVNVCTNTDNTYTYGISAASCTGAGGTASTLSTQSDQLLVTTGVPSQDAFSLSASTHNIEGGSYDGVTTTITALLGDHFNNWVPDGTAVYFTSEGGSITSSCTTLSGACSVTLTSKEPRPHSSANGFGRLTVLATAIGEESFTDLNGNGYADPGEMIDANGHSTDIGYAYVDYAETGVYNGSAPNYDPFTDFYGSGSYTTSPYGNNNGSIFGSTFAGGAGTSTAPLNYVGAPAQGDGLYHGVLCNPALGATFCSTQKSIDVRDSLVIVFSTSDAAQADQLTAIYGNAGASAAALAAAYATYVSTPGAANLTAYQNAYTAYAGGTSVPFDPLIAPPALPQPLNAGIPTTGIVLSSCTTVAGATANAPSTVTVTVVDQNGNAMPAGTTVAFSASAPAGFTVTPASYTVPDTTGCRAGFPGCPASSASSTFGDIPVTLASSATYNSGTCTNNSPLGTFTVKITTPNNIVTYYTMSVAD